MEIIKYRSNIKAPAKYVFNWHTLPGAFERLTPPWERLEVLDRKGGITNGARVVIKNNFGPISFLWVVEHRDYIEGKQFRDVQISGPFTLWEHTHKVIPDGTRACFMEDEIKFILPLGFVAHTIGKEFEKNKLNTLFKYRHATLKNDIIVQRKYGIKPMKIIITGSSGLVGSSLIPFLSTGGHHITRFTRSKTDAAQGIAYWDPAKKKIDASKLEGFDAVVHLSGENVAGRWTSEKKAEIENSRVNTTEFLCKNLAKLDKKPKVLVCASAIGFYGDRGDEILTEQSVAGSGFLAEVAKKWESATDIASKSGIRVVNIRFGVVLSPKGGALEKMLLPFQMGLGGKIGSGEQYISWISIDDAIGVIYYAITGDSIQGPLNAVSPNSVTNLEFTKTLGRVLNRPTIFPVPSFVLKFLFGEMAEETLLASARVEPSKLLSSGYEFLYPDLEVALRHLLGKL
jgi:uncharacterized protein